MARQKFTLSLGYTFKDGQMVKSVRPGTFGYLAINQCMCTYTKTMKPYFYSEKEGLKETSQP